MTVTLQCAHNLVTINIPQYEGHGRVRGLPVIPKPYFETCCSEYLQSQGYYTLGRQASYHNNKLLWRDWKVGWETLTSTLIYHGQDHPSEHIYADMEDRVSRMMLVAVWCGGHWARVTSMWGQEGCESSDSILIWKCHWDLGNGQHFPYTKN